MEQTRTNHLCCMIEKKQKQSDTSPVPKALPKPEDHERDLLYCTFEWLRFTAVWKLHMTRYLCAIHRLPVSFFSSSSPGVIEFAPQRGFYLQWSNICMWLTKPSAGAGSAFLNMRKKHTPEWTLQSNIAYFVPSFYLLTRGAALLTPPRQQTELCTAGAT